MKKKNNYISTFKTAKKIYELVGDACTQKFLEYDLESKQYQLVDQIEIGEELYLPPENDLVAHGTLLLPSYPLEYGETIELFEIIRKFIRKYVDIPDQYVTVSALYVLMSWLFDFFTTLPYLRVIGDFGTGKSRFLQVIGSACYRPCFAGGASSVSPIFRIIEIYGGVTLVFDEADFAFSGPESEMIKILNCGYSKGMPVLRTEGDGNNRRPASYNVYGPKILGTRKRYQDLALESRCLTNVMTGKKSDHIPYHLPELFDDEALELRNKLLLFRLRNYGKITPNQSLALDDIDPRINQIALPILSILDDEAVKNDVKQFVTSLKDSIRDSRSEEEPAQILKALIQMIRVGYREFKYSDVSKKIDEMNDHTGYNVLISSTKIGKINKSVLNLEKRAVNGVNEFKGTKANVERIQELSSMYGVKVDDVDLVELFFKDDLNSYQENLIEEVKDTLL